MVGENQIIKFNSRHPSNRDNEYFPSAVKNYIPKWYIEKDKYKKNEKGEYELVAFYKHGDTKIHKMPTWKSCPAMLDIFLSGYYLLTPCDIEITKNDKPENGGPFKLTFDPKWGGSKFGAPICGSRGIEDGLPYPEGYEEHTYIWILNWAVQVPKGYTVLITHPININNLPFKTISGFVDASNTLIASGNLPFYIKKDWEGVIPAGTPYAQVIPMKNEEWNSQVIQYTDEELLEQRKTMFDEYVIGHGMTKYKELDWLKKHYE